MGRDYRHMAELHPDFRLDLQSCPQLVLWRGKKVVELTPIRDNSQLMDEWVFIVGSGPSLKSIDISPITNHSSFGVNGSVMKFIEHQITPDYYVISDASFIRDRWEIVQKMFALKPHCIFTPSVLNEICEHDPNQLQGLTISVFDNHFKVYEKPILSHPDIIELAARDSDIVTHDGKTGFSLNPNKGVFTAHTVIYHSLQIAYGLGFRKVGILGMDLSTCADTGETRFYESGTGATPSHVSRDYYDRILPSFMVVKYLCERNILSVYNLSLNSRLPDEVLPKTELHRLLDDSKSYESAPQLKV
jgi:Kdo-III transferase WaaZ